VLALGGDVAVVTLGAEHPAAPAACRALAARGVVVALGHTDATFAAVQTAVDAGARLVTHLFNATGTPRAREPGIVGAALTDERLTVGLIADLVHVHPALLRLAFAAKGARGVCLVSDAVAWRRTGLGGRPVALRDGAPRLPDGMLAGSSLALPEAVRNLVASCGLAPADALTAATATPAAVLGLADRGRLAEGLRADLVALDPATFAPRATWVAGELVAGASP
jgi:N-acetylglucosamine-6-phosphate deacetylase